MGIYDELTAVYRDAGDRYILPFVGEAFRAPSPGTLRVAAVGINAYLSNEDWTSAPPGSEVHDWFASFWEQAGVGRVREQTWPFYVDAFAQTCELAAALASSQLFAGLAFDANPATKPCLYGTNAVKKFLTEEFVDADKVSSELINEHAKLWHRELDLLAKHQAFPHVIVVFGERIWEAAWQALHHKFAPGYRHLEVVEYETSPENSPSYHHANRLCVRAGAAAQTTLLVRVAHPATRRAERHDATWLLGQAEFRTLARL